MSGAGVSFSQFGRDDAPKGAATTARDIQELWFLLARRPWSSLVLVPAGGDLSTGRFATLLAQVGGQLRDSPVTAIVADRVDYESVRFLTDLQLRVTDTRQRDGVADVEGEIVRTAPVAEPRGAAPGAAPPPPRPAPRDAQPLPATGQVVVAIPPVVVEPLGVAIAHAADAVVVCLELGKTRLSAARRTIELIGADRILGAFLVR